MLTNVRSASVSAIGVLAVLLSVALASDAGAQAAAACTGNVSLTALVDCRSAALSKAQGPLPRAQELGGEDAKMLLVAMAINRATAGIFEDSRVDEQVGAGSASAGTTSLVSAGAVPTLISLALENGAITQSQSGNTVTLRTNVPGLLKAIHGHGFLAMATGRGEHLAERLSNLTAAASFDTGRGVAEGQAARFTGDKQQLSAWSVRGELFNNHAAHLRSFWDAVGAQIGDSLDAATAGQLWRELPVGYLEELNAWLATVNARLVTQVPGNSGETARILTDALRDLPYPESTEERVATALTMLTGRATSWIKARPRAQARAASGSVLSTELATNRAVNGVSLTTARVIWARTFASMVLTLNTGVSFFPDAKQATGDRERLQAADLAAQIDVPFGAATGVGRFVLSSSYKFLRNYQDPIDLATGAVVPGLKENVHVGQVKVTVPTKGTGVKIPISVTIANRTDAINETVVRGNIGISYDLDALLARAR